MKFSILALGAAVAGIVGAHDCAAQSTFQSAAPNRVAEGRLVSQVADDFFGTAPSSTPAADDSPFFGNEFPAAEAKDPDSLNPYRDGFEPRAAEKSVAVSSNNELRQAPLGVLANIPEVGMVPVYW